MELEIGEFDTWTDDAKKMNNRMELDNQQRSQITTTYH